MAKENSVYIGPRLRRIRRDMGLTQAAMAADLDISPSYVALIERNQRPLTADLLLKLAKTYPVDLSTLAGDGGADQAARIDEVMRDPLLTDLDLAKGEARDMANSHPGMAEALIRLFTAYREGQIVLANQHDSDGMAGNPLEEIRTFLAARRNCFPVLDEQAERLAARATQAGGKAAYLAATHQYDLVRLPRDVMNGAIRRLDLHRRQLALDEGLDAASVAFQLASQLAYLEMDGAIRAAVTEGRFEDESTQKLARRSLANYAAGAILMPYSAFLAAAQARAYDVEALGRLFGTSFEQTAHRLTTLQKSSQAGIPFFFIRVDAAGNVSKRFDGSSFPFARHGGSCPRWSLHQCFQRPREIVTETLELPDGAQFFSIARTVTFGGGAHGVDQVTRAVALGCDIEHAPKLIYTQNQTPPKVTPIGVTCRLCHRSDCAARAEPPIGRAILPDDYRRLQVPFGFADG